jgi:hypothetical protein
MKITVEISDFLLDDARKLAVREAVTLRALVERGLSRIVEDAPRAPPFKLRRASFNGHGLQPERRGASWDQLREGAYGDRDA